MRAEGMRTAVGQLVNGEGARIMAAEVERILGTATVRFDGPVADSLPAAWEQCRIIISHLALGATTRLIAPLLSAKATDPAVIVIDAAGRFVIPLVGGHAGGANALAERLADGLGGTAVITTATDALGIPALDTLGWDHEGALATMTRAVIDGRAVLLTRTQPWPLPPLPANVSTQSAAPVAAILVTDEQVDPLASAVPQVVLHPRSLIVGLGCNQGTPVEALRELLMSTMQEAGLSIASLAALTSIDAKAEEPGMLQLARELGIPFHTYASERLAAQAVPTPSAVVASHMGTPSVAEASVLAYGAALVIEKRRSAVATCAIGRVPARGRLSVVGLGPGSRDLLTPRARLAITSAGVLVGYSPYVDQIRDLVRPGTLVFASGMGTEEERTGLAIAHAREGRAVTLVCSGDPAIYAMASPVLEQGTDGIDVDIVPGVTASLAVSAILGAPLGHDHVTISLSDLHTDWETIERRLIAAAEGDLVTVLYNPRSRTRTRHLPRALEIMLAHRPPQTPVAAVREAGRPEQQVHLGTLASFDPQWVDMNSLVIIGSSTTRYVSTGMGEQRMVTPRDYRWMPQ
ncbi:MAG: precorrin-3B C(17)-methyltransferase [Candidatus Nanopelagicales bacterium]